MRKMIHVATAAHEAMQALAHQTGQSFQDLVDEAIVDLLKKHKRPVTLNAMLTESLAESRRKPARKGAT
jgi:hypothetical protein